MTDIIDSFRHRLEHLGAEGRRLRAALLANGGETLPDAFTAWQRECGTTISQLSGGSKAHWLSRAFSEALLVPAGAAGTPMPSGAAAERNLAGDAGVTTIIDRLLGVLEAAGQSLAGAVAAPAAEASAAPRARFQFIENTTLRSGLESAYRDGQQSFAEGDFSRALLTNCSILETIITDALERAAAGRLAPHDPPAPPIVEWPFAARIAVAERAGIISRGCARLPSVAREYRALVDGHLASGDTFVTEREAKLSSDVLHVILRDLAPGR
jgi:hypothetical protein